MTLTISSFGSTGPHVVHDQAALEARDRAAVSQLRQGTPPSRGPNEDEASAIPPPNPPLVPPLPSHQMYNLRDRYTYKFKLLPTDHTSAMPIVPTTFVPTQQPGPGGGGGLGRPQGYAGRSRRCRPV